MSSTELSIEIDGVPTLFHFIWLRDHCHCSACFFDTTKQRLLNSATIDENIHPAKQEYDGKNLSIVWSQDNHLSEYPVDWLRVHAYNPPLIAGDLKVAGEKEILERTLWTTSEIKDVMPVVDFPKIMASSDETDGEEAIKEWCLKLWKYGFTLIDNVPVTPEDTEKLCEKLMYIRPTHYGGFWDFTSDLGKKDTAYTNFDISSHTDGTYWSDTPGLQLFHLLYHDGTGGTTSLVDAFQCAEKMKKLHPESYDLLTKIPIRAHSAGEEKVCIQPDIPQPIFKLDLEGNLIQVRWNQSDRSCMDIWENPADVPKFYQAIRQWYKIISSPENEIFYQLKPGQCLIFDNWRCFHLRTEFTGKRRLCGAYINRDDFVSRLKLLNLGRKAVLDSI
ncbi:Trimethyllysine dioxygenase [Metschnikowia bicuspidata var. bicuspidata NRRL YB-4993]|uniref:Trimethyllysine dioxygenase n=1 Tax=Metschnikowia bicuspidata var. bicuspidata NRRL YB-4993 TaxID=869754 RepID=A0A1A0H5L0_9ASCO|nr:Trimethyllysine dioxygenase [Metschnikowia bicuspidata var. bicuspidata NRRL YB-4993]OBA19235.1 Trimethyllysine dioxygenase [Metschnikowia bicuspidata var. bicuspidata NRRL YB-4993]